MKVLAIMRSRILFITLILMILLASAFPAMAHDGELHPSDVEMVVSGVGVILMTLAVASLFIKRKEENDIGETKNGD